MTSAKFSGFLTHTPCLHFEREWNSRNLPYHICFWGPHSHCTADIICTWPLSYSSHRWWRRYQSLSYPGPWSYFLSSGVRSISRRVNGLDSRLIPSRGSRDVENTPKPRRQGCVVQNFYLASLNFKYEYWQDGINHFGVLRIVSHVVNPTKDFLLYISHHILSGS